MKWLTWFAVGLPLMIVAHADLSSFSDFDFTAQPKVQDKDSTTVRHEQVTKVNWVYNVTAENKSARDYTDVEFQYIIFRKEALVANKSGASKIVRKTGSAKAPAVAAHGRFAFTTEPMLIETTQLTGGYHWRNGANSRDFDTLQGIWIKVLAGGKQVGEFTAPSDLANREKWEGPAKP